MKYFRVESLDDNGRSEALVGYFNSVISKDADEFRREYAITKGWKPDFGDINWYSFREVPKSWIEDEYNIAKAEADKLFLLLS